MGICRVGFVTTYMGDSLVSGFTTGAAVHVFTSQVKYALGLKIPRFENLFQIVRVRITIIIIIIIIIIIMTKVLIIIIIIIILRIILNNIKVLIIIIIIVLIIIILIMNSSNAPQLTYKALSPKKGTYIYTTIILFSRQTYDTFHSF